MSNIEILKECPHCSCPTRKEVKDNVIKVFCLGGFNEVILIQIIDKGVVSYPDRTVEGKILEKRGDIQ